MQDGVLPQFPVAWTPRRGHRLRADLALSRHADIWLRHPILGDPSYDGFVRHGSGPFVRGTSPFRWPVNGFLFEDPRSKAWFAYVGMYLEGYDIGPGRPVTHCRVWRSENRGATWTERGMLFDNPDFRFDNDPHPANVSPDVSVVTDRGRYVLAYDWIHDNADWAAAGRPGPGTDGGVGIAVADSPEGPWRRLPRPVLRTSEWQRKRPGNPRYRRPYATSLIRRRNDWLLLTDVDSGPHFAWGLIAMTAPEPEGPWSEPVLVKDLEGDEWLPVPVESFPAFVHDGWVYDPRTSVGRNRNYQMLWRAPIERAHTRDAWSPYQDGSLWHSEPVQDEGEGIWGQTLAGFVDARGMWNVLYPCRAFPGGEGTIRTASRPWKTPLRSRGFVLSAHGAPSTTRTRSFHDVFRLETRFELRGGPVRLAWGWTAPLGTRGRADGEAHPWVRTRHRALAMDERGWKLVVAGQLSETELEFGTWSSGFDGKTLAVTVEHDKSGRLTVSERGTILVDRAMEAVGGAIGWWLEPRSHLRVDRFHIDGVPLTGVWTHLWTEGIAGAGVADGSWEEFDDLSGTYGRLARCLHPGERVKWNFRGTGFRLRLPKGPGWGKVAVRLDGQDLGQVDLRSDRVEKSSVVVERLDLRDARHALVVRSLSGAMPVDCLDALHGLAR